MTADMDVNNVGEGNTIDAIVIAAIALTLLVIIITGMITIVICIISR